MSEKPFEDRVAFVTGGTKGIGKAAVRQFAEGGARVALSSRHLDEAEDAAAEIADATGQDTLPLEADISDPEAVTGAYDALLDRFGQLDIVFANAGVNGRWAPIEELTLDDWKKTLDINLTGTFLTVKHAVPHLKAQGGGAIVITASVNGTRDFSLSGASAYATSKAGQVAFMQMLALELASEKIRVNAVCPGKIATQIEESTQRDDLDAIRHPVEYPAGKIPLRSGTGDDEAGTPEEVAALVAFLASDRARFITGSPVWVDGAQSLFMG